MVIERVMVVRWPAQINLIVIEKLESREETPLSRRRQFDILKHRDQAEILGPAYGFL
jgi:hypothetical protein